MMKSIEILMDEHQNILRGLKIAETLALQMDAGKAVDAADVSRLVDFIRQYADEFHHMKEEDILFTWMAEKGLPRDEGPLHCMLDEHEMGRRTIDSLVKNLHTGLADVRAAAADLRSFVNLLRQHIFKEDNVLYNMAEQLASEGDDAELVTRFLKKCDAETSRVTEEKYAEVLSELERRYVL